MKRRYISSSHTGRVEVVVITPSKHYKCQHCKEFKDSNEFYTSHTGRASPYCIKCNPDASLLAKYKTEIRRRGAREFGDKIKAKENQLRLMLQAASELNL